MKIFKHEFVDFVPSNKEDGILYISIKYCTAVHKCACGCGELVVTPLSPTDWKLIFDGHTITLDPSIGNWSYDCKSHYWIKKNNIIWAERWSQSQIEKGRKNDSAEKKLYYDSNNNFDIENKVDHIKEKNTFLNKIKHWIKNQL